MLDVYVYVYVYVCLFWVPTKNWDSSWDSSINEQPCSSSTIQRTTLFVDCHPTNNHCSLEYVVRWYGFDEEYVLRRSDVVRWLYCMFFVACSTCAYINRPCLCKRVEIERVLEFKHCVYVYVTLLSSLIKDSESFGYIVFATYITCLVFASTLGFRTCVCVT